MKHHYACRLLFLVVFFRVGADDAYLLPGYDGNKKIYFVESVKATEQTLQGYGRLVCPEDFSTARVDIVTWPASGWRPIQEGTGNEGGTVEGEFCMRWKGNRLYATNHAVGRKYLTGWATPKNQASKFPVVRSDERFYVVTFEANYHPDGGQLFVARDGKPFVLLLALPGDDVAPADFRAFYCDGSFGVHVNPGVWHQPPFPIEDAMTFFDRQGRVHACVAVNFPEEFGCYLAVPLFAPEV